MNTMKCPHCADGQMAVQTYEKSVQAGRRKAVVGGLARFACDTCAGELVSRAQMKENNRLISEAADRESVHDVDVTVLKQLREEFDLTQRDASCIFGAGASSFGKWESGQSAMSTPAALLIRCALDVPGVLKHLALLRGVLLSPRLASESCRGGSITGDLDWTTASVLVQSDGFSGSSTFFELRLRPKRGASRAMVGKVESTPLEFDDDNDWTQATSNDDQYALQPRTASRLNH